jgi:hypothetical protein
MAQICCIAELEICAGKAGKKPAIQENSGSFKPSGNAFRRSMAHLQKASGVAGLPPPCMCLHDAAEISLQSGAFVWSEAV